MHVGITWPYMGFLWSDSQWLGLLLAQDVSFSFPVLRTVDAGVGTYGSAAAEPTDMGVSGRSVATTVGLLLAPELLSPSFRLPLLPVCRGTIREPDYLNIAYLLPFQSVSFPETALNLR